MKHIVRFFTFSLLFSVVGCSSNSSVDFAESTVEGKSRLSSPMANRLIQKSASLSLDVDSISDSTKQVYRLVASVEGYVDSTISYTDESTNIVVKVPSEHLDSLISELKSLGKVTSETRNSRDVTDEVTDIEARLKNLKELRSRFRQLLSKAEKVEELLSIERELARIQTEIDFIESRKKTLIGNVEQSRIDVKLNQKTVLGPLGYFGKGLFWAISKLFVIK